MATRNASWLHTDWPVSDRQENRNDGNAGYKQPSLAQRQEGRHPQVLLPRFLLPMWVVVVHDPRTTC